VDNQDRLGALRLGTTTLVDVIPLETPTPGFTVFHLRGYWNLTERLHFVAGIDNLFDRNYLEHLNLRLPDAPQFAGTQVLEPGITPYFNVEWTR
jgi:outer membrane receptor protein involved in Fe transport